MPKGNHPKTEFKKGHKGYWKGRKRLGYVGDKNPMKRKEVREKSSKAHLGYKVSEKTKKKISNSLKGEKSYLWKGGITLKDKRIRNSIEFRLWREAVFARDNWTCQKYGTKGGELHPHHIKNFAEYPELRFAIDNGITFSKKAHREFHKKYGMKNNNREQLEKFLIRT